MAGFANGGGPPLRPFLAHFAQKRVAAGAAPRGATVTAGFAARAR